MSEDKLASFLKDGPDWGRMKTSVPGIFILRLPAYRNSPTRLAVELNPADQSGSPTKKRGLVLRSSEELKEFRELFEFEKLLTLLESVDRVNPSAGKRGSGQGEEVLKI